MITKLLVVYPFQYMYLGYYCLLFGQIITITFKNCNLFLFFSKTQFEQQPILTMHLCYPQFHFGLQQRQAAAKASHKNCREKLELGKTHRVVGILRLCSEDETSVRLVDGNLRWQVRQSSTVKVPVDGHGHCGSVGARTWWGTKISHIDVELKQQRQFKHPVKKKKNYIAYNRRPHP